MFYPKWLKKDNHLHSTTVLFLVTVTLVGIGLVMIYSASAIGNRDSSYYLRHQFCWLLGSVPLFMIASSIPYREFQKRSLPLLMIGLIMLGLTLTPWFGVRINGSQRWFEIPLTKLRFQPAEMIKLILIIFMADFISRKQNVIKEFRRGFLPLLIPLVIVVGLVGMQPHLGMGLLMGIVILLLLAVGGVKLRYLVYLLTGAMLFCGLAIWNYPYQLKRILVQFPSDSSIIRQVVEWRFPPSEVEQIIESVEEGRYHPKQLISAIGNGKITGQGPGGSQQKLGFVPVPESDSIFAILAEEFGFLGTGFILLLFLLFLWIGVKIALTSKDMFGSLLAFGLTTIIVLQASINIAVNTGMMPTTGLPMPFISYGGSSLVSTLIGVGILLNVSKETRYV
ncbi:MAG: putative peptidoglycan glycosyltransferase FtsW [bacterium]